MRKFTIKVARIETSGRGKQAGQVRVTFQVDSASSSFQVPILLRIRDFDDTEMIQAARSALHRTFAELASQSQKWKLSANDLKQLSHMSLRPKPLASGPAAPGRRTMRSSKAVESLAKLMIFRCGNPIMESATFRKWLVVLGHKIRRMFLLYLLAQCGHLGSILAIATIS